MRFLTVSNNLCVLRKKNDFKFLTFIFEQNLDGVWQLSKEEIESATQIAGPDACLADSRLGCFSGKGRKIIALKISDFLSFFKSSTSKK